MKIKTSELKGAALDWAVAKCEGLPMRKAPQEVHDRSWWIWPNKPRDAAKMKIGSLYSPSTDWSQGGPIIEREDISFRKYHRPGSEEHGKYYAMICRESGSTIHWKGWGARPQTGPTPLIAAMRCYVASKLGDEVDVPGELVEG